MAENAPGAIPAADDEAVAEGDVAGEGEEDFETGMRQNAMERDAADADNDGKLDFGEFCQFVHDREEGEFTEEELKKRFDLLDEDGSGKIDMFEYLEWSLKDALLRSSSRVIDLFRAWDEDKNGTVDKSEFHKAIKALGFEVERDITDSVFESLDDDNSGALEYKELNAMLRKGVGAEAVKTNLKRMAGKQRDDSRGAKMTAKNINKNYSGARVATLPDMIKLDATSDKSLHEQLRDVLTANNAKLIDLFREWDDDGNGALDKKEMRKAIAALGYDVPRREVDGLFDSIDVDSSGYIEYEEVRPPPTRRHAAAAALAYTVCHAASAPACPSSSPLAACPSSPPLAAWPSSACKSAAVHSLMRLLALDHADRVRLYMVCVCARVCVCVCAVS